MTAPTLFEIRNLRKLYQTRSQGILSQLFGESAHLKAVDDVSFDINEGEILGLAGQSGCGKSTLGELLVGLQPPTDGEIRFRGENILEYDSDQMKAFREKCQVIFQDPYEALNPRFPVTRLVSEPLTIHGIRDRETRQARIMEALQDAGLRDPGKYLDKLPSELSGGQRQRVCIARALVLDPDFIVADEPVSMLDVSVQTAILNLFHELQEKRDLAMLYVSHDLSTINYLADRTMIMYLGDAVEIGPTKDVIHEPSHPYTESLLDAVPQPDPDRRRAGSQIQGEIPDPINLPSGCRFHPQCPYKSETCVTVEPPLEHKPLPQETESGNGPESHTTKRVACHHPVGEELGIDEAPSSGEHHEVNGEDSATGIER
ncbi:ABC transporter ATP-binding protein [Natrononativus amylolyticus]|uniref:ABC transporter ATP-binding protein n=1 Tax=Natrononativus amylolyticus TaxID=2963434 RepID=UPI0020CF29A8|nr:ABC transporter ATP-binding protein [Natrononativus amylolyticus]